VKQEGKAFFALSVRAQAAKIGCHRNTWRQTKVYQEALAAGRIKPPKPTAPKAVSLTAPLEGAIQDGERDEVLKELGAAQHADGEASPLAPGRRKHHVRKRL
jgi:hypothetical protein